VLAERCISKKPLLIMDDVRFHHSEIIKQILSKFRVEYLFLPPYNPELNLIENLFSVIKCKLNTIRPRATSKTSLINNIERSIGMIIGGLSEYYRSFWERVSSILNRQ
jgi:transposase